MAERAERASGQAGWIGAAFLFGFFVFITLRGELPAYRAVIGL